MTDWQQYLDEHEEQFIQEMLDFLRIPSISGLSEHMPDIRRAAEWVAERAKTAGMENVQIMETGAHPLVYADWLHAPGKPTVAIYGHYDVQPVDPLDLWENPPFDPVIKDDRVYARGASDDKGNMLVPILAVEALLKTRGELPLNLKFFFEGQEEIGSPNLENFIAAHKDQLACDLVVSADGGQWSEDQPALMIGLRGLASVQIDVTGPDHDVHSGMYGGAIQNPIHALAEILASFHGPDGTIRVQGFYDDVTMLLPEDREHIAAVPYDEEAFKAFIDVDELFGEPGYTPREQTWARPTLEINGIWGGFQGEGVKTVIPSTAHAKISCRLVANQDPEAVIEDIIRHVETHTPPGAKVTVTPYESVAGAYLMPADHPGNQAARDVHLQLYGKEPYYARSGGSIPFCTLILEALGVYTVNFAFALSDELQHSPNEFFRLSSFRRGQTGYCLLLDRLAEMEG
jgi:acetylornithine deacetylase/succinyl-diaminopimelate desuccinylase-like protein